MKTILIRNNNSNDLIVYLSGWGCDGVQFKNMTSSKNVLICWDYTDLDFEFDFSKFENIDLITYSAGVFIAGLVKDKFPKFNYKVAINGNPLIFDKYFGAISSVVVVLSDVNPDNYMDFRRNYLVVNEEQLEEFNANAPERSFESCNAEFHKLVEYSSKKYDIMEYDKAILSDSDKIFNLDHQKEYYKDKYVILKGYGHDVFGFFKSYDDIINY